MDRKLLELAVDIVQAQASMSRLTGEEIESSLIRTYNALHRMNRAEEEGTIIDFEADRAKDSREKDEAGEMANAHRSIQEDKVTCLECGAELRQLTANHLKSHQLSPRDYKRKWGFPLKQPLAAKSLTKMRSKSAKKRGLPQNLQQYLQDKRQQKTDIGEATVMSRRRAGKSA